MLLAWSMCACGVSAAPLPPPPPHAVEPVWTLSVDDPPIVGGDIEAWIGVEPAQPGPGVSGQLVLEGPGDEQRTFPFRLAADESPMCDPMPDGPPCGRAPDVLRGGRVTTARAAEAPLQLQDSALPVPGTWRVHAELEGGRRTETVVVEVTDPTGLTGAPPPGPQWARAPERYLRTVGVEVKIPSGAAFDGGPAATFVWRAGQEWLIVARLPALRAPHGSLSAIDWDDLGVERIVPTTPGRYDRWVHDGALVVVAASVGRPRDFADTLRRAWPPDPEPDTLRPPPLDGMRPPELARTRMNEDTLPLLAAEAWYDANSAVLRRAGVRLAWSEVTGDPGRVLADVAYYSFRGKCGVSGEVCTVAGPGVTGTLWVSGGRVVVLRTPDAPSQRWLEEARSFLPPDPVPGR